MSSEKDKERFARWRKANPDKVRAQNERRKARIAGTLEPWVNANPTDVEQAREKNIQRMKRYRQNRLDRIAVDPEFAASVKAKEKARYAARYAKIKNDPVAIAARREKIREWKRLKRGIPLDAPIKLTRITDEERARRLAEKERIKAERLAAKPPKMSEEERKRRRREWQRAYDKKKLALKRAKRSAEVAAAMASYIPPQEPKQIVPDPPELVALFRKASKGEPPRPYDPTARKYGAIEARSRWV